ncbi:MAG: response regulator [Reichenbachiella sp.]
MKKSRILIVEDEPLIADDIALILEKHNYKIVGIVDEAVDALEIIQNDRPDLALLDVNIEGDKDGIELASEIDIPFVFLTSYYDESTLNRAKKTNPSGYVVKPFNENELIANIEMAAHRVEVSLKKNEPQKLFFKNDKEIVSVMSSDILYVEAFDNYAYLHTEDKKFIISHTLKSIEDKIQKYGFVRIHRSFLVNFDRIDSISEGYVFVGENQIQIGKTYRKEFFEKLSLI